MIQDFPKLRDDQCLCHTNAKAWGSICPVCQPVEHAAMKAEWADHRAELAKARLDPEHYSRLDAERVTIQFRVAIVPRAPQNAIEDLPLFGGERQKGLFE